ncbi:MAG: hypothetical protein AAF430_25505 [Myxococcota bacterium]
MVALPCWIALNSGDLDHLDDADLELTRPPISPAENGFTLLKTATAQSASPLDEVAQGRLAAILARRAADPDWIDQLASKNAGAFDLLDAALATERFQIPVFEARAKDAFDPFLHVQHLVRVAAARAQTFGQQGMTAPALRHATLGMRMSRKLSEATGTHILALTFAWASQSISLVAIEELLRSDLELSPAESRQFALELEAYRSRDSDWVRAWATEYQWTKTNLLAEAPEVEVDDRTKELWRELDAHAPPSDWVIRHLPQEYLFHPKRTLARFADMYRRLSRRSQQTCLEWRNTAASEAKIEEPTEWETFRDLLRPNYVGWTTLELIEPTNGRFLVRRCVMDTRISLVQALAGLNAHLHATGRLPDSLEDLVPRYLPATPKDHFDGRPLRYSAGSRTVYSIGDDFIDDGPPTAPSQIASDEPAIRL